MTTAMRRWRDHRKALRDLRAVEQAIYQAPSPSMRNELIAAAQRHNLYLNR